MATNPTLTQEATRGRDDPVVTDLVTRARNGERQAWDALVERYVPLIWSICRRHRLEAADAAAVAQNVWLKLVDQLDKIRDPAALPGWLAPPPGANAAASCARPRHPTTPGMRPPPGPSQTITPRRPGSTCSRPSITRPCGRRSGRCPRPASSFSPCSATILRCRTRRSAPGWASRPATSGRAAAAAWTSCAATRPSPR